MTGLTMTEGWALHDVWCIHRQCAEIPQPLGVPSAIVLASGRGEGARRLSERLTGIPMAISCCRVDGRPSALHAALAWLDEVVSPDRVTMIADRRDAPWVRREAPGRSALLERPDGGSHAVDTLRGLVARMVVDPDTTVVLLPADHVIADPAPLRAAVKRAIQIADEHDALVVVAREPDGVPRRGTLVVPFARVSTRGYPIVTVARYLPDVPAAQRRMLLGAGCLVDTGILVAKGRALLALFAQLTPQLVRLLLYGAALPALEAEPFLVDAQEGLGPLDIDLDLLALARGLRVVALPRTARFHGLDNETEVVAWLAEQRRDKRGQLQRPGAKAYRRRIEPCLNAAPIPAE